MKENIDNIIEIKMSNHLSFKNNKDNLMIIISSTDLNIVFNRGMGFHTTGIDEQTKIGLRKKNRDNAVVAKLIIKDNIIVLDFNNKHNLVNSTCCYTAIKEQYEHIKRKLDNSFPYNPAYIRYVNSKGEHKMIIDDSCTMFNFGITPKRKYTK